MKHYRQNSRAGFTLVEMLLVVAIIGILAAVVVGRFAGQGDKARAAATRASIATVGTAVEAYQLNCGRLPQSLQNLVTSSGEPAWEGPYTKGGLDAMKDGWGNPLTYTAKGDNDYEIRSPGKDRVSGNEDDITSWTN